MFLSVRLSLSLILLAICLPAPGSDAQGPTAPAASTLAAPAITRDIVYTSDSTGSYSGDLYRPAGSGPFPAIILIHGGSWRSGNKKEMKRLSTDLAEKGYVCFAIDYDVHPLSFPYSWEESRAAVEFLHAHAAAYGVDPNRIAVLGTSAGGQLAALLALAPDGPSPASYRHAPPPAAPDIPVSVRAAVLFNGGYDAHPSAYVLRRYLGGRCKAIPGVCNDASPDFHVHPGAPPIFVGHGTSDHLIPYSQATGFVARLRAAGDPVTPFIATGAGHSYWRSRKWYAPNLSAAEQFLQAALAPSPADHPGA